MFGKILNISDSKIEVEINKNAEVIPNLMNLHVVFGTMYERECIYDGEVKYEEKQRGYLK